MTLGDRVEMFASNVDQVPDTFECLPYQLADQRIVQVNVTMHMQLHW